MLKDELIASKTNDSDYKLSRYLKALSHPVRIAIIRNLLERCRCPHGQHPCSCGEGCEGENCKCGCKCGTLVNEFPMSQSTISQHLKELKSAGLIELSGRKGNYTLNHSILNETFILIKNLLSYNDDIVMERNQCGCCE